MLKIISKNNFFFVEYMHLTRFDNVRVFNTGMYFDCQKMFIENIYVFVMQ